MLYLITELSHSWIGEYSHTAVTSFQAIDFSSVKANETVCGEELISHRLKTPGQNGSLYRYIFQ